MRYHLPSAKLPNEIRRNLILDSYVEIETPESDVVDKINKEVETLGLVQYGGGAKEKGDRPGPKRFLVLQSPPNFTSRYSEQG